MKDIFVNYSKLETEDLEEYTDNLANDADSIEYLDGRENLQEFTVYRFEGRYTVVAETEEGIMVMNARNSPPWLLEQGRPAGSNLTAEVLQILDNKNFQEQNTV